VVIAGLAAAQAAVGWTWVALGGGRSGALYLGVATMLSGASVALGVVVAIKRPDNLVGALLAVVGLLPIGIASGDIYAEAYAARPDVVPVSAVLIALSAGTWSSCTFPRRCSRSSSRTGGSRPAGGGAGSPAG
jgi:hypothetical protein